MEWERVVLRSWTHRRRVREQEQEKVAQQEAAEEGRRHEEEHHLEKRQRSWEEEAMMQRHEREGRVFQRAHGVAIPETPQQSKIHLRISTPISAPSAGPP